VRPATGRLAASTDVASANPIGAVRYSWSPWRAVVGFGVVSMAVDMVYEGARLVHRTIAGIARCLCSPGGAGQWRGRSHGAAAAPGFRIVG